MKILLLIVGFSLVGFCDDDHAQIVLDKGSNRALTYPNLSRVAVANSKIVSIRSLPGAQLLLTAKQEGRTNVTLWFTNGSVKDLKVRVLGDNEQSEMVKISLEFLELDRSFHKEMGIRWPELIQASGQGQFFGNSGTTGLSYSASFDTAQGFISQLLSEGWASLIANPDLFVRLGKEATFHSGGEIPVATSQVSYGRQFQHISWKSHGTTVKVRPESTDGVHMQADISVEISEPFKDKGEVPSILRRTLDTKVNALEGEPVLLSGLFKQSQNK